MPLVDKAEMLSVKTWRADKRHGGRADANVAEGGERRPSRHGVNSSLKQLEPDPNYLEQQKCL